MSEVAATQIRRRIGLFPSNFVQELEALFLHREAHGVNHVTGTGYPHGAIWPQGRSAHFKPRVIELVHHLYRFQTVPRSLVDRDHSAGLTGNSAVGEKVRRIRENQVS